MKTIGLDFGTTNSILSYFNEKNHHVETYKVGGVDGDNYIPSVIAMDEEEILFGKEAKSYIGDDSFTLFSKFKILLGEESQEKLQAYQYDKHLPQEMAKIYIDELIKKYKSDNHIEELDSIVVTVPEIWLKDDHLARSRLVDIIKELNLPLKRLVSEPIAAGAYFLHNFKQKNQKSFNGHLLIFDYGGGTLDITLLDTQDETIKVLERSGKGKDTKTLGRAGVAYDDMVISHAFKKHCDIIISKSSSYYYETLDEFESSKIKHKTKIDKHLSRYLQNSKIDRELFKLACLDEKANTNRISIYPSDLVEPFSPFERDIKESLQEIKSFLKNENIDTSSGEKFRVVMVGGFSSFYLSSRAVRDFFGSKTENDSRFESYFSDSDRALAISKGAALIAKDIICIDETYPLTVKIPIYQPNIDGHYEERLFPIFKKGERVTTYKVEYLKQKISKAGTIILVFNDGSGDISFKEESLKAEKLFPNIDKPNNRWQLGFSIDENSFVYLHIKDSIGEEKITELGDLIREFRERIIAI